MGPILHCFLLKCLSIIFIMLFSYSFLTQYVSSIQPPSCWDFEISALLKLKESFILEESASYYKGAYPKVHSWKVEAESGSDCCSWDGVECDNNTGHVIGLDLSSSFLYGSIDSNSSLFELLHLTRLDLSDNNFNHSKIPSAIGNLSRLSFLDLSSSVFSGQIPTEVLDLSKFEAIDLSDNSLLTGCLPEIPKTSSIKSLRLADVGFSGELPKSIGNLKSLEELDVGSCNFSGSIPTSLANLIQLTYLSLADNRFSCSTISWLGKLYKLTSLDMSFTKSCGDNILPSLKNLTQLTSLDLYASHYLSNQIPYWIGNLTKLTMLELGRNELWGPIPQSIFTLMNLEVLYLDENHLTGTYKLESFLYLKNLTILHLSQNNLSLLTTNFSNVTVPKFTILMLSSCNLHEFPDFLSGQDELEMLDLSQNKIHGFIPKWIWGLSAQTLVYLNISRNFLTGFEQPLPMLQTWTRLRILAFSFNKLQGFLPIFQYTVSNKLLMGEVSPLICNLTSLFELDVSNNNISGMLPPCLGNLRKPLEVLNLQSNNFHGPIPRMCRNGSKLRMIDFSQNQLDGQIPRSMVYCSKLESLNLGNNQIKDTFPFQLAKLPKLKILILRHNRFHGAVGEPETSQDFPKLRILDLSFNNFEGHLPSQYFQRWEAMKLVDSSELKYLQVDANDELEFEFRLPVFYPTMTMTNKGVDTKYEKIQEFLVVIDLSSNQFEGSIPEDIQILQALQLLNLSNNFLSGPIPPSLANLTHLESLDLSKNKLSGKIPQELAQLTFLEFLNVSHNRLREPIPQGKQFATFENSSFGDNPGLCGKPLSKKCYPSQPSPWSSKKDGLGDILFEFSWKIVALGYGSGVVVGLFLGYTFNPWKHKWFVRYFGGNKHQRRRRQRS